MCAGVETRLFLLVPSARNFGGMLCHLAGRSSFRGVTFRSANHQIGMDLVQTETVLILDCFNCSPQMMETFITFIIMSI